MIGELLALNQENEKLEKEIAALKAELSKAKAVNEIAFKALQKIDEPLKYHHYEQDDYTRAGCFQFVAHEAVKAIKALSDESGGGGK